MYALEACSWKQYSLRNNRKQLTKLFSSSSGFPAAPGQGMKITFEALAKAAQMGPPLGGAGGSAVISPSGAVVASKMIPPASRALSLADLEKQMTGGSTPPTPAPASGGGPQGFTKDAQASQALMGMLRKAAPPAAPEATTGPATMPAAPLSAAPSTRDQQQAGPFGGLPTASLLAPAAPSPTLTVETSSSSTSKPVGLPSVSSLGSLSGIWGAPAAAQQQPPPSLSSIWGAPTTPGTSNAAAAVQPPSASPAAPPSAQAAAASLFEHLSNTAAAGTNARPPAPATSIPTLAQQPQPQQGTNPLMALFAKAQQQQQQQIRPAVAPVVAAPADDTLNSMLKDLGIGPEPPAPPQQRQQQQSFGAPLNQPPPGASALQDLFAAASRGAPNPMQQLHMQQLMMQQQMQQQQQQQRPPGLNLQAALQMQQMQANFRPVLPQQGGMPPLAGNPGPAVGGVAGGGGFSPAVMQQLQRMQMMQMMQLQQQQQQQYQQFMQYQAMQRQQGGGGPGGPPGSGQEKL